MRAVAGCSCLLALATAAAAMRAIGLGPTHAAHTTALAPLRPWWHTGKASECEGGDVRRYGLKMLREMPFVALFEDLRGVRKFEASGMSIARGNLWVVFDNLHSIARIDEHFSFRDAKNKLYGQHGDDSQFEDLAYDPSTGHFFAIEEAAEEHHTGHLHPFVQEVAINERTGQYDIVERCPVYAELTHENKGFEGLHFFRDPKDPKTAFLMGLCEGNYCSGGSRGRERGNGRILLAKYTKQSNGCGWIVFQALEIPPIADFKDYSGMDLRGDKIVITSQEDSAMFVGTFDTEALEFVAPEDDRVYYFPRNEDCEMIYCNVEGVAWLDETRVIVTSDRAKSSQAYRCTAHDQSIHVFALPP